MSTRLMIRKTYVLALLCAVLGQHTSSYAVTLVGDGFVAPTTGWLEASSDTQHLSKWRLNLHLDTPMLMETNNQNPPSPNSAAIENTGIYEPNVLVRTGVLAAGSYEYSAMMHANDDDIIGLVWNYQDPDNYFRVGIRQQAAGSFGGTQGLAVQKIVGGVLTQLSPAVVGPGAPSPITQAIIDNRTPFELKVVVDGPSWEVLFNGNSIVSGSDSDLESDRMIGVQSWAMQTRSTTLSRSWGAEIDSVSLSATADGGAFSESLAMATPVKWRNLQMTNSAGISIPHPVTGVVADSTTAAEEDIGNFGQALNKPWIVQDSNGFENGTAGNVDFIGPAIALDEPGSSDFSDYRMNVRLGSLDNDGYGVLLRVQDDDNFYRVTFHADSAAIGTGRPPRGMSIQKVRNGVWSELHRDDQGNIPFLPPVGTASSGHLVNPEPTLNPVTGLPEQLPMFNVIVSAVGDTLKVRVVEDDGTVTDYGSFKDLDDPILSGTVGLFNWGSTDTYYMAYGYGGQSQPFLVAIPEPSTVALALLAGLGLFGWSRRRK